MSDMSASGAGRQHPHANVRDRSVPGASYAQLASRPLHNRSSTVIDAQEMHRVLECSQLQRRSQYQQLVREYTSQILVGCKNSGCETLTCFARNARNATRPYRPPSQLTAFALANYLASQDDPHQALCPHGRKIPDVELSQDNVHAGVLQGHSSEDSDFAVCPTTWTLAHQYRHANSRRGPGTTSSPNIYDSLTQQAPLDAINGHRQTRRDMKSLGQNLYDSLSMMSSCVLKIPNPVSVLALLRVPTSTSLPVTSMPRESAADGARPTASLDTKSAPTNAPTVMIQTIADIVRQQSQQIPLSNGNSRLEQANSNAFSNGHQILKIPYQPPTTVPEGKAAITSSPAAPHCSPDATRLSIKKTGKKSFTLGGGVTSAMGRSKPPSKALKLDGTLHAVDRAIPALPVFPTLDCDLLDELKEHVHRHRKYQSAEFNFAVDYHNNRHYRPTTPFVNRSLFYTLSDPNTLLESFRVANREFEDSPLPHLDSTRLVHSFRDWNRHNGALIFDSLWSAVEAIFTPPPELHTQKSPCVQPLRESASQSEPPSRNNAKATAIPRYLTAHEAAHIVVICIHALTSLIPVGWPHVWSQVRKLRSWGIIVPNAAPNTDAFAHPFMDIIDELEYEPALRLVDRLLRAIGARICFEQILIDLRQEGTVRETLATASPKDSLVEIVVQHLIVVERVALNSKRRLGSSHDAGEDPGWTVTATFLEWLRTVMLKKWDSKPQISKWGSVGVAVQLHNKLHAHRDILNLRSCMFEMPYLNERIDPVNEPSRFLEWVPTLNQLHIFQYPSLFSTHQLVTYFRTVNFTTMFLQYNHTVRTQNVQTSLEIFLRGSISGVLSSQMKTTFHERLFLTVSRENALEDTLDALWGQEQRMLLKPLKVKIGMEDTGEYGTDLGGVTNEYFSLVLGEAFKPDNGMFTIDPQTRMTWFQPDTLEAPWKFEMIGLLFSLAVYNGVTLPVTFPLAFYHMMLHPISSAEDLMGTSTLDFIKDGWPDLAKVFNELLSWSDGDVGDIIMRDFVFSYEVFGQKIDHDMNYPFYHDPLSDTNPATEPDLVTNANREEFVRHYVYFLTYASIEPQLLAFRKGFMTCLQPKSLQYFTPTFLRNLVEGSHHISIPSLRRIVVYEDGYTSTCATIRAFWTVVESYSQDDARRLLEFVTASDRIPVTGYENLVFKIYKVGGQPASLPSSSTCFGSLYLPDYGDVVVLGAKLGVAIRHSKGFGVL